MYKIARAETWEQIEEAATIASRCIRPGSGMNWAGAKKTWEEFQDKTVYFLIKRDSYPFPVEGYARLFNTSEGMTPNPTWAIDFMFPTSGEVPILIADELPGNVLVKPFFGSDVVTRHWPKLNIALNIPPAPYTVAKNKAAEWLVVIP